MPNESAQDTVPLNTKGSVSAEEVAAILNVQASGGVSHMMGIGVDPNFLLDENQSSAFPQSQLVNWLEADDTISKAMYFVRRHNRPMKRERVNESRSVIKLLKHWNRLTI